MVALVLKNFWNRDNVVGDTIPMVFHAFKDILKKTFCWCCPTRTDDGFPISSSGVSGGGAGGGFGGPLPNTNPDRLNVDYV